MPMPSMIPSPKRMISDSPDFAQQVSLDLINDESGLPLQVIKFGSKKRKSVDSCTSHDVALQHDNPETEV